MKRKRKSAQGRGNKSKSSREIRGTFTLNSEGYGFVKDFEGRAGDIFIPPGKTHGAFTGDIVRVSVRPGSKKGKGPAGQVTAIEERCTMEFTATLRRQQSSLVAIPDSPDVGSVIVLRDPGSNVPDHRVLVEVDRDTIFAGTVYGRVVEDFGHENDPAVDIPCVIRANNYETEFAGEIVAEAQAASGRDLEIDDRTDCRKLFTVTIDPKTAKDFDDAISIRKMRSGWEIWVHIADVAFYVPGGEAVDLEAQKRSNSVYLLTAVIPMLPEVLSNGACSLNPKVDRAAKTLHVKIDKFGEIKEYEILRTVIRSDRRFNYEEVQAIIEGKQDSDREFIMTAHKAACCLRKNRYKKGTIVLDLPEIVPVCGKDGAVKKLKTESDNDSHQLIEDLMLLANRCVADFMISKKLPGPFRSHLEPMFDKKQELSRYLSYFGYKIRPDYSVQDLQDLISRASGKRESYLVNLAMLRAFTQAEYSLENEGHYALGFDRYLHFTSPIRRYADLIVHRRLDRILFGRETGKGVEAESRKNQALMVIQCNSNERRAMSAEGKLKTIKILRHIDALPAGTLLDGILSQVREDHFSVELVDYQIYGRLHFADIYDSFGINRKQMTVYSRQGNASMGLGDEVKVKVKNIDIFGTAINFDLAD